MPCSPPTHAANSSMGQWSGLALATAHRGLASKELSPANPTTPPPQSPGSESFLRSSPLEEVSPANPANPPPPIPRFEILVSEPPHRRILTGKLSPAHPHRHTLTGTLAALPDPRERPRAHLPRAHASAALLAASPPPNSTKAVPFGLPEALFITSLRARGVCNGTLERSGAHRHTPAAGRLPAVPPPVTIHRARAAWEVEPWLRHVL